MFMFRFSFSSDEQKCLQRIECYNSLRFQFGLLSAINGSVKELLDINEDDYIDIQDLLKEEPDIEEINTIKKKLLQAANDGDNNTRNNGMISTLLKVFNKSISSVSPV